jgi:hypothetical protein
MRQLSSFQGMGTGGPGPGPYTGTALGSELSLSKNDTSCSSLRPAPARPVSRLGRVQQCTHVSVVQLRMGRPGEERRSACSAWGLGGMQGSESGVAVKRMAWPGAASRCHHLNKSGSKPSGGVRAPG